MVLVMPLGGRDVPDVPGQERPSFRRDDGASTFVNSLPSEDGDILVGLKPFESQFMSANFNLVVLHQCPLMSMQ